MAYEIVISVASKVAEYTVAPIGRQLGYIIFYRSNVEDLNTKLRNLVAAKVTLQNRANAAKDNGEVIHDHVQAWLVEADDTVAKANGFQNHEGHARVGCSIRSFPNLWTRHRLSRKATKMMQVISQVLTQASFNEISYLPRLLVASTPFARGYEPLQSRTSILNEIMEELKNDNIYMIGVCGMGGVGKSTLIKEVAWQAEHAGSFGVVIVATITSSPDVKRIQAQLADGLGLKFTEESEEGRARRLQDRIRKEKQVLVIMDDIWKKIELTEIGVPFGDDHKGCKLLISGMGAE